MNNKSFIKTGISSALGISLVLTLAFSINNNEPEPLKTKIVKEF